MNYPTNDQPSDIYNNNSSPEVSSQNVHDGARTKPFQHLQVQTDPVRTQQTSYECSPADLTKMKIANFDELKILDINFNNQLSSSSQNSTKTPQCVADYFQQDIQQCKPIFKESFNRLSKKYSYFYGGYKNEHGFSNPGETSNNIMMIREAIRRNQTASASPLKSSSKLEALRTLSAMNNNKDSIKQYITKLDSQPIAGSHKKQSSSVMRSQAQMRKMIRRKSLINYKQIKHQSILKEENAPELTYYEVLCENLKRNNIEEDP